MKKMELIKGFVNKTVFQIEKHSPEILAGVGTVGVVVGVVMACKATTKVSSIVEESKIELEKIHDTIARVEGGEEVKYENEDGEKLPYTLDDGKKDLTITYAKTAFEVAKTYAPAVILTSLSLGCLLTSNNILRKRNVALAAAYATVDKAFKDYRGRVIERFGEELDRELKYNVKTKVIEETVVDEDGEEMTVKKPINVVDEEGISGYARLFGEYTKDEEGNVIRNNCWENDREYNVMFLSSRERFANDLLRVKRRVFLNDIYDMLGFPRSKEGQIVGWNLNSPKSDGFISFGIDKSKLDYSDYIYGDNGSILLDFNVDGNVWSDM